MIAAGHWIALERFDHPDKGPALEVTAHHETLMEAWRCGPAEIVAEDATAPKGEGEGRYWSFIISRCPAAPLECPDCWMAEVPF